MAGVKARWSDEQLISSVPQSETWRALFRLLGLSPSGPHFAVRKRIDELGLDISHFLGKQWNKGKGSGRNPDSQRASKRKWYQENKEYHISRNRLTRTARQKFIRDLKWKPCMDCEMYYPYFVMEFDHRPGEVKLFNVATAASSGRSTQAILDEIAKCDLVCANCHRFRTAVRNRR